MDITHNSDRNQQVEWSRDVLDVLQSCGNRTAVTEIKQAIDGFLQDRFILAVLGKAKRGKSTLLNALLGRKDDTVAPIDKLPASSAISRFRWAETERAMVFFRDGRQETIAFHRIREYVTEEHNKENFKGVDVLEIEGPFPGLDHDLELVDTPGAASLHEHHDALLHAFIPQADAVIFLVTARMPLDQDELDLLRKVKAADIGKVFFAINRVDQSSETDIEDAVIHNTRLLAQIGVNVERIYRISAKQAFQGDLAGSGVAAFMQEIAEFLAAQKGRVLSDRFESRIRLAVQPVCQALAVELASSCKTAEELDSELRALHERKRMIESERTLAEREFTLAWSKAVDVYEEGLKEVKSLVLAVLTSKIEKTSVFEVSSLAKQLPTVLTQTIDDHLHPLAVRFEESVREACNRLHATYPTLNVGDVGAVAIRSREGNAVIAGSLGGAATAAAGLGLVSAGSAAAASIAATNAAAVAATTTLAAPSLLSGVLNSLGLSFLAPLTTGTVTVATPATVAATPLWVALAGPVGWTLVGIGVLAVPFSWRVSKLKLKDKITEASQEQVVKVFNQILTERIPAIRKMGKTIVEEIRLNLDRQLEQVEAAMVTARDHRPSDKEVIRLSEFANRLHKLIEDGRQGQGRISSIPTVT
ncbi:MAG: dynamin family protein [Pirellulales bacterium]|nr:dynamin family protein [Pirellulales bacterium]